MEDVASTASLHYRNERTSLGASQQFDSFIFEKAKTQRLKLYTENPQKPRMNMNRYLP